MATQAVESVFLKFGEERKEFLCMPMPRKATPEKYCLFCGRKLERKRLRNGRLETLHDFNRRKFCDQDCMAKDFSQRPVKDDPQYTVSHKRARRLIPSGPCSKCGSPNASDVHHKNGNWRDNSLDNLERLCRSCHIKKHRQVKLCIICGKPQTGLGYCEKHYRRFRKYGNPYAVKRNQFTPIVLVKD